MRSRILRVAALSVLLAVVVLGLPLGFAVNHLVRADERSELERLALRSAVRVSPDAASGDPVELPATESDTNVAVYDVHGRRVDGHGPIRLESAARGALKGRAVSGTVGGWLVSVVPVGAGEHVVAVVRAAEPGSVVHSRSWMWLLLLSSVCAAAILLALVLAATESRRLARPLERLAGFVDHLGEDQNQPTSSTSGVAEIDAIDAALRRASARLHSMIARERAFSAQASHQLRTPMTRLQLDLERGLESGGEALQDAARSAMETADQLAATIDDVLDLARGNTTPEQFDVESLLEDCRDRWEGTLAESGRPLRVLVQSDLHAEASLPAVRQVMHVLMDNAAKHGQGSVTLQARESHGAAAIDVIDEGSAATISIDKDGRIGLPLARTLLLAEGGRLLVDQRGPGTRFTALLPLAQDRLDDGR